MAENEKFHAKKYVKNLKFFDIWELYTSKESLEHVQYKFNEKKYDFFQKKRIFLIFSIFFPKGGPFDVKIVKKIFFRFSKILKTKPKNDFHGTIQT